MSDEARPLSRRERRALEQRMAAGGDADVTELLPTAPVSEGAEAVSRRERRRLERMARPMETWTAEEEMIATGQFPAMTPEAIAEQETLARERAAEAEAEARKVASDPGFTPPAPDAEAPVPERVSTMLPMGQVASPEEPAPDAEDGPVPDAPARESGSESEATDAAAPTPHDDDDDMPEAFRGMFPPGSLQATALAARSKGSATPLAFKQAPFTVSGSEDGADEIRRLTEEAMASLARVSPAYEPEVHMTGAIDVVEPPTSDELPPVDGVEPSAEAPAADEPPVDEVDEVDEVGAVDGVVDDEPPATTNDAPAEDEATDAPPSPVADEAPAAEFLPVADDAPAAEFLPGTDEAPAFEERPAREFRLPAEDAPADDAESSDDEVAVDEPEPTPSADAVEPFTLADVPFVSELPDLADEDGDRGPSAPVWDILVPASDVEPGIPLFEPVYTPAGGTPAPTVWDTHPLTGVPHATPVRELEDPSPSADVPRPDMSVLLRDHTVSEVAAAAAAYQATEPETTTGSTPVERRVPELQPAGGARHFRWAHLAVIGAIAFVLGVLVWNIARSNS